VRCVVLIEGMAYPSRSSSITSMVAVTTTDWRTSGSSAQTAMRRLIRIGGGT
jgi:hypothetical protein